jgi:hypothetical protein
MKIRMTAASLILASTVASADVGGGNSFYSPAGIGSIASCAAWFARLGGASAILNNSDGHDASGLSHQHFCS